MSEAGRVISELSEGFDPGVIRMKPGSQRKPATKYVSHGLVTKRLNAICPGWSTRIIETHTYLNAQGVLVCAGVTLELTIPGVGSRVEVGTANQPRAFGDDLKNAMSDALKRCAMRFGVALDLWEDMDEHDEDAASPVLAQPARQNTANPPPAFVGRPRETPGAASAPADSLAMARQHALKQFGPVPATLPEVEAQLAPLAKQARTNDEALSPGEYQRYHDLEARRKELRVADLPPFSPAELTATIDQAWTNAENGWALGAIRDDLNRQRHRMTKAQMDTARDELAKIEAQFYAPAGIAG